MLRNETKKVAIKSEYYRWPISFIVLFLCVTLLALLTVIQAKPIWAEIVIVVIGILVAGKVAVSETYIQKNDVPGGSKKIRRFFAILLVLSSLIASIPWLVIYYQRIIPVSLLMLTKGYSVLLFLIGALTLIKSRLSDRRWLSIYALCLAALLLSSVGFFAIYNMDLMTMQDLTSASKVYFVGGITGGIGIICAGWLLR